MLASVQQPLASRMVAQVDASGIKKSTAARYACTLPYFEAFCSERGLAVDQARLLVRGTGVAAEPVRETMIAFLEWMASHSAPDHSAIVKGRPRIVSHETFDTAKKWLRSELNKQLSAVQAQTVPGGWCKHLPGIEAATKRVDDAHRTGRLAACTDADQRSDFTISVQQQLRMAHAVLAGEVHAEPLQCLNAGFAFRGMQQMANRGENFRDVTFNCLCTAQYPQLLQGEVITGLRMKNVKGKTTQSGDYVPTVTSCFPHRNPLLCPIGQLGLQILHRFTHLAEPFPSISAPSTWCHLHVLRATAAVGGVKAVSKDAMLELFKRLFEAGEVEAECGDAYTHEPRHQAILEAQKAGVPKDDVDRGGGHELKKKVCPPHPKRAYAPLSPDPSPRALRTSSTACCSPPRGSSSRPAILGLTRSASLPTSPPLRSARQRWTPWWTQRCHSSPHRSVLSLSRGARSRRSPRARSGRGCVGMRSSAP